jgi:hypothetical protein
VILHNELEGTSLRTVLIKKLVVQRTSMHKSTHYMSVWQQPRINEAMRPANFSTAINIVTAQICRGQQVQLFMIDATGPSSTLCLIAATTFTSQVQTCRTAVHALLLACLLCCWHHPIKYATHSTPAPTPHGMYSSENSSKSHQCMDQWMDIVGWQQCMYLMEASCMFFQPLT